MKTYMNKRKSIFLCSICLVAIALSAIAYHKDRIIPSVKVEGKNVIITITTQYPSNDVKLFVSYEDEVSRGMKAFPEYRYTLVDEPGFKRIHTFTIPMAPEKTRYIRGIPAGVTSHFRVSCIMLPEKTHTTYVRSKNYSFRIIKTPEGEYKPGLCFTRSPVVANLLEDRATIWWETNLPAQTRFIYYRDGQEVPSVQESDEEHRRVEINLEGLKKDSIYYYQIECISPALDDTFISERNQFRSGTTKPDFVFAFMSDCRGNAKSSRPDGNVNSVNVATLAELTRMAWVSGAHFILFPGDLISGYTTDEEDVHLQYSTWCDAVAPVSAMIPFYAGMGNHDTSAPWREVIAEGQEEKVDESEEATQKELHFAETIWADIFALPENGPVSPQGMPPYRENVYSFNYGDCHFVMLNSDYNYVKGAPADSVLHTTITKTQQDWLEKDLRENIDTRFIFVAFHCPAYPTSVHQKASLDRLPEVRDAVWDILNRYKVDMVINGHEHLYTRLLVDKSVDERWTNPIWQMTAGRAGAPWYPVNTSVKWKDNIYKYNYAPHFVRAEVKGSKVWFKVYDIDGNVVDEFIIKQKKRSKIISKED